MTNTTTIKRKVITILTSLAIGVVVVVFTYPGVSAQTIDKEALEAELNQILEEILIVENQISANHSSQRTLSSTINRLRGQESKVRLEMQKTDIHLTEVNASLTETADDLVGVVSSVGRKQDQLAEALRILARQDNDLIFALLDTEHGFSSFFDEVKDVTRLTSSISKGVAELKTAKIYLEELSSDLEKQQDISQSLLEMQALQQGVLREKKDEQTIILKETQGEEELFQQRLGVKRARAGEIRNAVYELLGIDSQITFGQAVDVANWASSQTGVRPAFLLAILKQESNLGKNVGTCNRVGDPAYKGYKEVMKPSRDIAPFERITAELGVDPNITPISCPMYRNGAQVGYGGAMGPAQFIPSTWVGYQDILRDRLGHAPNPWDIRDAFLASALLLRDNGAARGGGGVEEEEWKAALRYFSGSVNTRFRWYADQVLERASGFAEDIEAIR